MEHPDFSGVTKTQIFTSKIPIFRKSKEHQQAKLRATWWLCNFVAENCYLYHIIFWFRRAEYNALM